MPELRRLVNERKYIRKCITEKFNRIDTFPSLSSKERDKLRLQFDEWVSDLKCLDKQILSLKWEEWGEEEEDRKFEEELKLCQEYNAKALECIVLLKETASDGSRGNVIDEARSTALSLLKSPIAPLPKYCSTEDEDLERFFSEFEDTLSKFNYPDYDKLLLLKQQISGRALTLVNSLEADKRGYVHAKELLLKAFASGDTQKFSVIHQLSELCLDKGDDPYEFISKVRLIIERVRKLNVDVDTIIQFFVWKGMNNQFKEHLIQITNNARPSLKQIADSFFEACDRFISKPKDLPNAKSTSKVAAVVSSEPSAASMAVNVKYNKQKSFKPCTLCSKLDGKDADHPIFKCNKFDTCKSKLEKLSNLNICVKCSNLNHESNTCHFKFLFSL